MPTEDSTFYGSCANCGAPSGSRYCPECGQRAISRLTFNRVLAGAARQVADLDFAAVHTFVGLSREPGHVIREYIEGRRRHYSNPLKYLFVTVTVLAVSIQLHLSGFDSPGQGTMEWAATLLPYLLFVIGIPVAYVQRRLFPAGRANWVECYVALLFLGGHFSLVPAALLTIGVLERQLGVLLYVTALLIYFAWALKDLYETDWAEAVMKGALLLVLTVSLFGVAITAVLSIGFSVELPGS